MIGWRARIVALAATALLLGFGASMIGSGQILEAMAYQMPILVLGAIELSQAPKGRGTARGEAQAASRSS